ncbi:hypothetical protein O181_064254 [Austropuccinia psidii MF-1]|uniref:Alpha-ketoglutarate-dependent dioxygenase AlkB-like domain-containing protein n=1 Tax=Austropuccinia psidii MF-1 TaxID=1389203 RepID=A0A9Q3EP21_9BASI|nr:hypothetical protein [Austropuccinia psidii MF-1]
MILRTLTGGSPTNIDDKPIFGLSEEKSNSKDRDFFNMIEYYDNDYESPPNFGSNVIRSSKISLARLREINDALVQMSISCRLGMTQDPSLIHASRNALRYRYLTLQNLCKRIMVDNDRGNSTMICPMNSTRVDLNSIKEAQLNLAELSELDLMIEKCDWQWPTNLTKIGGNPPIYSENRQELCESLPYFRSYHGGHYISKGRTLGYLLDGSPAPRDVFADSGKVIISHGGGGSKLIKTQGDRNSSTRLTFIKSQERSSYRVKALLKCLNYQIPVALIAGTKYAGMPWLKDYYEARYFVLGFYLVTHCWPEKEAKLDEPGAYCTRFKFRFQWMASQGDPWWLLDLKRYNSLIQASAMTAKLEFEERTCCENQENNMDYVLPESQPTLASLSEVDASDTLSQTTLRSSQFGSSGRPYEGLMTCGRCNSKSYQVYQLMWMCLNEHCQEFFCESSYSQFPSKDMVYVENFLKYQPDFDKETRVPFQLQPKSLQHLQKENLQRMLNEDKNTGLYCRLCGRLSSRIFWGLLVCCNPDCRFQVELGVDYIYDASELPSTFQSYGESSFKSGYFSSITPVMIENLLVTCFKFPENEGFIVHAKRQNNKEFGKLKLGTADYLFKCYQGRLGPREFKRNRFQHFKSQGTRSQQFTLNYGAPYKYCVEVESKPWETAKRPIVEALGQLNHFVDLLNTDAPHLIGDILPQEFNELLSCCYFPGTGMNFHSDDEIGVGPLIGSLSLGSAALMKFKMKAPAQSSNLTNYNSRDLVVLELLLKHGDMVLQYGFNLQRKFRHSIKTDGFRIAATARKIEPIMINLE